MIRQPLPSNAIMSFLLPRSVNLKRSMVAAPFSFVSCQPCFALQSRASSLQSLQTLAPSRLFPQLLLALRMRALDERRRPLLETLSPQRSDAILSNDEIDERALRRDHTAGLQHRHDAGYSPPSDESF